MRVIACGISLYVYSLFLSVFNGLIIRSFQSVKDSFACLDNISIRVMRSHLLFSNTKVSILRSSSFIPIWSLLCPVLPVNISISQSPLEFGIVYPSDKLSACSIFVMVDLMSVFGVAWTALSHRYLWKFNWQHFQQDFHCETHPSPKQNPLFMPFVN